MGGRGVAALDRDLEQLEAPLLEPEVTELRDEPRRLLAVRADQADTGPALVVVEDRPQAVGMRRYRGPCRHREQFVT